MSYPFNSRKDAEQWLYYNADGDCTVWITFWSGETIEDFPYTFIVPSFPSLPYMINKDKYQYA
jgi:hypothetical protein